ncbi:MAG TPA: hypothetical protein VHE33_20105 [Acidobacteriaceae bacterium]|nr:hypothetical protein [Acidobacteriaceae bacterium]
MTQELVQLTADNPLRGLQRADGTWSARDVQKSGYVHATWRSWELALQRGQALLEGQYGNGAGQAHIASASKKVGIGLNGQREVNDYTLTALGLFAACEQSQLPDLDIWFVHAGLEAAGLSKEVDVMPDRTPALPPHLELPSADRIINLGLESVTVYPDGRQELKFNPALAAAERRLREEKSERRRQAREDRDRRLRNRVMLPSGNLEEFFNMGKGTWRHLLYAVNRYVGVRAPFDEVEKWVRSYQAQLQPDIREVNITIEDDIEYPSYKLVLDAREYVLIKLGLPLQ